ncbi:hypothetical protein AB1286_22610 [Trinickia sp. NRRL B-1857]|uniref:hypothetical protein n=1 Tax=Trinickia sp. NRRL B-1857 TaxID=3162879 RepID=UPI003D2CB364
MIDQEQLKNIANQIKLSGYPLEHWTSSLLRAEGWFVTTNRYYLDSDDKRPREMDIIAHKEKNLGRFKVRTVILISCKKSKNSVWGFLRRPFPTERNRTNLFPVMITSNTPSINHSLQDWKWSSDYCKFITTQGLPDWFDVPRYDVFAHQQIPLTEKGKLHDGDMHSATMQLIKAQAYEMAAYRRRDAHEVTQFNLISLTEGDFVGINFGDGESIDAEEISEQVALASYKIDNCDHNSRVLYLTKNAFSAGMSKFTDLHALNVEFFDNLDKKFLENAIHDKEKRMVHIDQFVTRTKNLILRQTRSFSTPPYTVPDLKISLLAETSNNPTVFITAKDSEILDAARTPYIKEYLARDLKFFWGYEGDFDVNATREM